MANFFPNIKRAQSILKMRPHCSQSSRKNATPSSGPSPLASYEEGPPPPPTPPLVGANRCLYYEWKYLIMCAHGVSVKT